MPDSPEGLYQEQLRMRERLHALEATTTALGLQQREMISTLARVEKKVDEMATADEIARKVAETVEQRRRLRLTHLQKLALFVLAFIPAANLALRLAGIEGL